MIKQDSASFADSSCHSSPVGSVLFKNGFCPAKMLISRALHRPVAVLNSPVTFRFRRLFWPKLLRHSPSARLMRDKCACEWRAINALSALRCRSRMFSRATLGRIIFLEAAHCWVSRVWYSRCAGGQTRPCGRKSCGCICQTPTASLGQSVPSTAYITHKCILSERGRGSKV